MNYLYNHYPSINRLFSDFAEHANNKHAGIFRVDVEEKDNGYQIYADLPGVAKDNVNIDVRKDTLTVGATFSPENKDGALISERLSGEAKRSFRLPQDINAEEIDAEMKDGVLTLFLPKKKEAEKRRITIK